MKRVVLVIILLVLGLYILLHFSPVQTWVVKQVTSSLSKKLHTRVTVKRVDLGFFNKLSIEGVMIEDHNKDTLLYAGSARVKLTDWFFLKDKITLHYLALENTVVNMSRADSTWNYQFLVDYFASPKKKTSSDGGIELDFKEVHCSNIRFNKIDKWIGQNMIASLKKVDIDIKGIDFTKKEILVNELNLDEPMFAQFDYTGLRPAQTDLSNIIEKIPGVSAFKWNNSGWVVSLEKLEIAGGRFRNDKETLRLPYSDRFDGHHLSFEGINGTIENVLFRNDTLHADILLSSRERSGLLIKRLSSTMRLTPEIMEFSRLDLIANNSRIGNYYAMRYNNFNEDMSNFLKDVILEGKFRDTKINSDDLAIFAPELKDWNRIFYLDGNAKGSIENFSAKGLRLKSGNTMLDGNLAMRGLPDINSTFIDLKANSFNTTYNDLVAIIPALKNITQPQLSKLGNIYYKGNFTGFLNDFVTYGTISTNLGVIAADLNMKLPDQGNPAYSGKIVTRGFKLGQFLNNPQVGTISLSGKVAGSGFALNKLNANFDGNIQQVEFNGYNYQRLAINGDFKKNLFTGHLTIDDPNLKIKSLDGTLSLSGKEIAFNLDADLEHANLANIHFSKDNIELKGLFSLNFTGNNIDNFLGTARVYNASLKHDSTLLSFDSLTLSSFMREGEKSLTLQTNELDAEIAGKFTIMQLPDAFKVFLSRYYPAYIKKPTHAVSNQDFVFRIKTKQVSEYLQLLDKRIDGLNNSTISGSLNLANSDLKINAIVPEFVYDKKVFTNINLKGNGNRDTLKADIAVDDITISDSLHFPDTKLQLTANNDVSEIHLKTSAGQTLNDAELNASIQTLSDGVKVHFFPSSFIINDKKWQLEKDGELTVRKKFLDANEIKFIQDNQQITLSTELDDVTDETHIVAKLQNLDIADFMPFIFKKPELKGLLTGTATVRDPFGKFGIDFKGVADSFSMDNNYMGKVNLDASANTVTGLVKFKTSANENNYVFDINGSYNYKDSTAEQMDIDLTAGRINLKILEPYLAGIFSNMEGMAQSNLKITGGADHRYITGQATIENGSVKVAYTQCKYLFDNETITFRKDEIDLANMRLRDTLNNEGSVSGKMYHRFFQDFSFDRVRFETGKMLLLNTSKKDNSQFYGTVIGQASMNLNGPVTNLVMDIEGQPSVFDTSHIYLPTGSSKESNAVDYIEFIQFGSLMEDLEKTNQATNIVVNMTVAANPACKIDVILDEETGDVIKGEGSGILNIRVGNKEPLSIRGRYDITGGEYTFNFQTFLKKPFTLNRGSISWSGDPYQAQIDILAEYLAKNVDISSLNLSSSKGFKQKEDVTIISHLTGVLKKPDIDFEFRLPEKSDASRDYIIVKKLEEYKNDLNERNKQVASLLLFNAFIAPEQTFLSGGNTIALATSTIGGVISGWLTNVFNKQLLKATNGVISTYIDINPTVDLQQSATQLQANVRAGLQILLSNRLVILVGGNLDYNNSTLAQVQRKGLLTPDISLEWLLNKEGTVRVVGFNRSSIDATAGQRNRSGIQLSYRKDFNKLSDIFKSKKRIEEEHVKAEAKKETEVQVVPAP